jgi:predicted RecA/RadA family phage recombinase
MKTYAQDAETVEFTAPSGGVVSGSGYLIGSLFVVATHSAAQGALFRGRVVGIVELPKTSAQAWTEGAKIYWDTSPAEATTTSSGNTLIGVAAAAAANPSATGKVRLDGVAR